MSSERLLPVPDESSAPFWEAAAKHRLVLARCSQCDRRSHPPDVVCAHCHHPDPGFRWEPAEGSGAIRSWITLRKSFLPGFEADVPFLLVDVALDDDEAVRLIGRLLDGADAALTIGDRVRLVFEDLAPGIAVPAFELEGAMTFASRNQVAVVGYAHSAIERHADRTLGSLTLETAQRAIADAGLRPEDIDGFTSSALFPTAGNHMAEEGVSVVSSGWLAERLGIHPRYAAGFQGFGQIPGSVALAVNTIASGAAKHVLVHRALHNPRAGSYHGNAMRGAVGSQQWTAPQGYFGPLAMIGLPYNEYLQRYGATREAMATVLVEARKNGARIPWSYWHDRPLTAAEYVADPPIVDPIGRFDCDIPVDGAAAFILTSAERAKDLPHRPVYISGYASGSPTRQRLPLHWPLDDIYETGLETASRLWSAAGIGPGDVDLPQLYDGFSPFVYFWLEVLGLCPIGEAHRFVQDGGIDSDSPTGLPILSGGGALGNGRMHGVPQMLECYLQLSGRAGERQRANATVGVACHASPHLGGAVVYTAEPG